MRLAILVSGDGSNFAAIHQAIQEHRLQAEIAVVISNNPKAYGLERAKQAKLPVICLDHQAFLSRAHFDKALTDNILLYNIDWIVLAGFMLRLGPDFVEQFAGRILNIHPSLLPAYKGLDTHARVLAAGETEHGTTVHLVTAGLDEGPILAQERLLIAPDDNAISLAQRIKALEHGLYPAVLQAIALQHTQQQLGLTDPKIINNMCYNMGT
jgi:phosphoribosylglycinamide formyltransferase-1